MYILVAPVIQLHTGLYKVQWLSKCTQLQSITECLSHVSSDSLQPQTHAEPHVEAAGACGHCFHCSSMTPAAGISRV